MELIALLPDAENVALPIAQVTVSVLPTYGMTLDDYATATSAELTRIANTSGFWELESRRVTARCFMLDTLST